MGSVPLKHLYHLRIYGAPFPTFGWKRRSSSAVARGAAWIVGGDGVGVTGIVSMGSTAGDGAGRE